METRREETAGLNHIDALGGKRRYALSILPRKRLVLNFYFYSVSSSLCILGDAIL
jgi:hypothetical protein